MEDRAEKLIRKYAAGDPETRVDIICKNYSNFERFIDACIDGVIYNVTEEVIYNRKQDYGNLGVRVQTSRSCGSPTESEIIRDSDIRDAIVHCKFGNGVLDQTDADHQDMYKLKALTLRNMKREYGLFM